jgi:P22_AR N-terminal domain
MQMPGDDQVRIRCFELPLSNDRCVSHGMIGPGPCVGIITIRGDTPETTLVAMRPVVQGMGLNWASQFVKIKANPVLGPTVVTITTVAADGKRREMDGLPLNRLNFWLATIQPSRVPAPSVHGAPHAPRYFHVERDAVVRLARRCFAHDDDLRVAYTRAPHVGGGQPHPLYAVQLAGCCLFAGGVN